MTGFWSESRRQRYVRATLAIGPRSEAQGRPQTEGVRHPCQENRQHCSPTSHHHHRVTHTHARLPLNPSTSSHHSTPNTLSFSLGLFPPGSTNSSRYLRLPRWPSILPSASPFICPLGIPSIYQPRPDSHNQTHLLLFTKDTSLSHIGRCTNHSSILPDDKDLPRPRLALPKSASVHDLLAGLDPPPGNVGIALQLLSPSIASQRAEDCPRIHTCEYTTSTSILFPSLSGRHHWVRVSHTSSPQPDSSQSIAC